MAIDLMMNSFLNFLRRAVLRRDDVNLSVVVIGAEEALVASERPALRDGLSTEVVREIVNGVLDLDRDAEVLVPGTSPDIEYGFTCLRFSKRTCFFPVDHITTVESRRVVVQRPDDVLDARGVI